MAEGNKFPPLIIFKGSNKTKIPKELYNNKNIKKVKFLLHLMKMHGVQGI